VGKSCEGYYVELLDCYYGESEFSETLKIHLKTCEGCRHYQQSLEALEMVVPRVEDVDLAVIGIEVDEALISSAFERATHIKSVQSFRRQLAAFILVAVCVIGMMVLLLLSGGELALLYFQGVVGALGLLSIPLVIRQKMHTGRG